MAASPSTSSLPAEERLELLFPPPNMGASTPPYPSSLSEFFDLEVSEVMSLIFLITNPNQKPASDYEASSLFRVRFIQLSTLVLVSVEGTRKWAQSVLNGWHQHELRKREWLVPVFGEEQVKKGLSNAQIRACVRGCELAESFCKALEERVEIEKRSFILTDRLNALSAKLRTGTLTLTEANELEADFAAWEAEIQSSMTSMVKLAASVLTTRGRLEGIAPAGPGPSASSAPTGPVREFVFGSSFGRRAAPPTPEAPASTTAGPSTEATEAAAAAAPSLTKSHQKNAKERAKKEKENEN